MLNVNYCKVDFKKLKGNIIFTFLAFLIMALVIVNVISSKTSKKLLLLRIFFKSEELANIVSNIVY